MNNQGFVPTTFKLQPNSIIQDLQQSDDVSCTDKVKNSKNNILDQAKGAKAFKEYGQERCFIPSTSYQQTENLGRNLW